MASEKFQATLVLRPSSSPSSLSSSLSFFNPSPPFSFPPSPLFLPLPFFFLFPRPHSSPKTTRRSGECCKLPSGAWGEAPAEKTIWCIYEPKRAALAATVLWIFVRMKWVFRCYRSVQLRHSTYAFSISARPSGHKKTLFPAPCHMGCQTIFFINHTDQCSDRVYCPLHSLKFFAPIPLRRNSSTFLSSYNVEILTLYQMMITNDYKHIYTQ